MSNRHLGRTLALQTLFEWDFHGQKKDVLNCLKYVQENFAPEYDDHGFTQGLISGVVEKLTELNDFITRYAKDWPLDQINIVDRNVLRLGIYELKYSTLPHKVVINESIELAKAYGGPSSGRFVNGVLGSVYRELEGQGILPRAGAEPELVVSQISAGGVIIRPAQDGAQVLLIKDGIGRFTFPKGKAQEGEDLKEVARREIADETGLKQFEVHSEVGKIQVTVNEPGKEPVRKQVHYFLMTTNESELNIKIGRGVTGGGWYPLDSAEQIVSYENARVILKDAKLAFEALPR